jgi:hypothetical protein
MFRVAEISGSCVRLNICEADIGAALNGLSAEILNYASKALTDPGGRCCVAHDRKTQRAYCFQRRGLQFYFHVWERIETPAIAERIFSKLSPDPLPIPQEVSGRIYRESLEGEEKLDEGRTAS